MKLSSAHIYFISLYFLSAFASLREIFSFLSPPKKDDPERISPLGVVETGDVLLSHNL
jgi:hypothetical protein